LLYRTWIWKWFHVRASKAEWLILATEASIDLLLKEAEKYSWKGKYSFLRPSVLSSDAQKITTSKGWFFIA
jgi:hypothetical protein